MLRSFVPSGGLNIVVVPRRNTTPAQAFEEVEELRLLFPVTTSGEMRWNLWAAVTQALHLRRLLWHLCFEDER